MKMENLKITKHAFVKARQDVKEFRRKGIVGFQLVTITFDFFGHPQKGTYDTKILKDGRQFVINGDGFIKDGFEII